MAAVRERAAASAVTVAELARIAQIASPRITRIACVGVFRLIQARKIGGAGSPKWLRGWAGRAGPGLVVPVGWAGPCEVGRGVTAYAYIAYACSTSGDVASDTHLVHIWHVQNAN